MLLVLLGCVTTEGFLEQACPAVRFTEIMTSQQHYDVVDGDWFEIQNLELEPIDLGGLLLLRKGQTSAYAVPAGTFLESGAYMVFVASTYLDPESEYLITGFDFNSDSDSVEVRTSTDRGFLPCDEVQVPSAHDDFSWEFDDPTRDWCFASTPTPEEKNAPCLCDVSDAC